MASPTLPKPWTATLAPAMSRPMPARGVTRSCRRTPWPVASERPTDPPSESGLPVTTPGTEYPLCIETVSMIQAITWAFVPTSGAGMSESGPMTARSRS